LKTFALYWQVAELSLFGSILCEDFNPQSDIDVLIAFTPEADWGLLEHVQMQQELQVILGTKLIPSANVPSSEVPTGFAARKFFPPLSRFMSNCKDTSTLFNISVFPNRRKHRA
jgi:Nucleotidyltransferase domain